MRSYGENENSIKQPSTDRHYLQDACIQCTYDGLVPSAGLVSSVGIQSPSVTVRDDLNASEIGDKNSTNATDASLIQKFHQKKTRGVCRPDTEPSEYSGLLSVGGDSRGIDDNMFNSLSLRWGSMFGQRSFIVDILAIFFGIGTWIGINGTFIQLPVLVTTAPEGWSLPSYLGVMVQLGNLGPLIYTILQKWSKLNDAHLIYGLLGIGTISALLTSFFYDRTAILWGDERHSIALFVLMFFTALNACTSSVLFMPYMGRFKEIYLVTYFIGEGFSGLLPSVVALIQGIGGQPECQSMNNTNELDTNTLMNETYSLHKTYPVPPPPKFDSSIYFAFIFVMMLCSCIGFFLLDTLKLSKREHANVQVNSGNEYTYERRSDGVKRNSSISKNDTEVNDIRISANEQIDLSPEISSKQYKMLLLLIGMIGVFANGIFNSIQSYSCLPYGGKAYHLSATLSVIANPVACFMGMFLPHNSLRSIYTMTIVASALTIYVFVTAGMSPMPPLYDSDFGAVLIIIVWTLLIGLVSYIKLSISSVMRSQGGKSLVWTGALTQIGSLIGSLFIFALINYTNSFEAAVVDECV